MRTLPANLTTQDSEVLLTTYSADIPATTSLTPLERALADGRATILEEPRGDRILYEAAQHSERWADPEEKVRAALWAELIYQYGYDPELIRFEVVVPRRTPTDLADLVIYRDRELKDPYFVFECKRPDLSDAEFAQGIEQACGNRASLGAPYAGAVAGLTRRLLRFDTFPPGERDKNHLTDIPRSYGRPPEWRFYKGSRDSDLRAVPREELRSAIRKCHQTLWEGGRRSPIAAFGEFCKVIFVKQRDETDPGRQVGAPYGFQRKDGESASELATRIDRLYAIEQTREPDVFTDRISIDAPIMAQCVEHLEGISLARTELDTKGVAFEEFLGSFFKGDFGQYFTPRELIAFCMEVLDPTPDDVVIDPACGSGGFLLYALDHIRRYADSIHPDHETSVEASRSHYRLWHSFAEHNLFGIEVNDELTRVAKMNMIIHDDGHTNIVGNDALDFMPRLTAKNAGIAQGRFDLVLTNPPFGASVKRVEKPEGYLEQYSLRTRLSRTGAGPATMKTEILFLERIWELLKPGTGRAAVIVPDGILTNSSLAGVREWLMEKFQLLGVVSLPGYAFAHYDAGVKASIIFLRRLGAGERHDPDWPVFMAIASNIGYDATGRRTFEIVVESDGPSERVEIHRCDLFDYRVYYTWNATDPRRPGWNERRREIIPNTGLVREWREFRASPERFLV